MDTVYRGIIKDKIKPCADVKFYGPINERILAVVSGLFKRVDMRAVVDWFRNKSDPFAAGEFFGKLMRAACPICRYTGDGELRKIIDSATDDILSTQDESGDISTVPKENQPNGSNGSDLWERKYVLLGLWEYYRCFGGERILNAMTALALYTASQIGDPPKTPVTQTGWAFCGIESSSILEPIVKIYSITGKAELLELADHIVRSGACAREDIFEAAFAGKPPREIGSNGIPEQSIAKAYEMMSCFEGLLEYYRVTGNEKYFECARRFIEKINEREITYLGSGGADAPYNLGPGTGEQWNDTFFEQANPDIDLSMETCVTVTYIKLMLQYYRLTADSAAVDRIEVSLYNALLGAMSPGGEFFEYFPRFNGTRSHVVNFSYDINGFPLSCCTANGPMGFAVLPDIAFCRGEGRAYVNLFIPSDCTVPDFGRLSVKTEYPRAGHVEISVFVDTEREYEIAVRIPGFAENPRLSYPYRTGNGYAVIRRTWKSGDVIVFDFDIPLICHPCPKSVNPEARDMALYTYGSLVMSRDRSVDPDFDKPVAAAYGEVESYETENSDMFRIKFGGMTLVPYYEAGASWDEKTEFRSWLKTK